MAATYFASLYDYQTILAVYDNDPAGQHALALLSQFPRIQCIHPPAHNLTDYWRTMNDLYSWLESKTNLSC